MRAAGIDTFDLGQNTVKQFRDKPVVALAPVISRSLHRVAKCGKFISQQGQLLAVARPEQDVIKLRLPTTAQEPFG
jgi:hypothetical protein